MGRHRRPGVGLGRVHRNPFFCPDAKAAAFYELSRRPAQGGSSIGAVIEVVAEGVPPGLGAPIYGKLDADLAAALMSINAVKGVEIGEGLPPPRSAGRRTQTRCAPATRARPRPVEPCGRRPGRHLHRPTCRLPLRRQADLLDSVSPCQRDPNGRGHGRQDQGAPRSLRGDPRGSGRRGYGRLRAGRSMAPSSGTGGSERRMASEDLTEDQAAPAARSTYFSIAKRRGRLGSGHETRRLAVLQARLPGGIRPPDRGDAVPSPSSATTQRSGSPVRRRNSSRARPVAP